MAQLHKVGNVASAFLLLFAPKKCILFSYDQANSHAAWRFGLE